MREILLFSIFIRTARFILWACLSMVILLPSTDLYAQDSDDVDDVEEYWGDDDYAPTKYKQKTNKVKEENVEKHIVDSKCAEFLLDTEDEIV